MIEAKIKLYIVDRDSIFRLGLQTAIAQYADFEIIGAGNISNNTLRELTQGLILNILLVGIDSSATAEISSWEFVQQLRQLYPQLPLFLLTPDLSVRQLAKLKSWGVRGYCDRSASINTIIEGLRLVAHGNVYWSSDRVSPKLWQKALARLSKSGRIELEQTLQSIEEQLASTNLSDWDRAFLIGRKRELLTARWLSSRLVAEEITLSEGKFPSEQSASEIVPVAPTQLTSLPVFIDSDNKAVFERVATDVQLGLINRTDVVLEIDLLQPEIKRSLCHLILKRLSDTIGRVPIADTIDQNYTAYLTALWSWSTNYFFTQHYGQLTTEEEQRLAVLIEQEFAIVNQNIFNYIYGIPQLFEYLLGKPNITIDNIVYQTDDPEAVARIEFLLHNLIIHLADGVMQIILNYFYDLEVFKYRLFQSKYRSDRELARFRNQLSWKYRQETYFTNPQNIFESRYRLFVLSNGAIGTMYIYAARKPELETLTGIPWLSTIVIETRDAIAPIVRRFVALAGSGVVFVLTQVIGKGLGLIVKGIIQGIGNTVKDIPNKPRNPRNR